MIRLAVATVDGYVYGMDKLLVYLPGHADPELNVSLHFHVAWRRMPKEIYFTYGRAIFDQVLLAGSIKNIEVINYRPERTY